MGQNLEYLPYKPRNFITKGPIEYCSNLNNLYNQYNEIYLYDSLLYEEKYAKHNYDKKGMYIQSEFTGSITMQEPQVNLFKDLAQLTAAAALDFSETVIESVREKGFALVALSGGTTPQPFFELLAQAPYRDFNTLVEHPFFLG